LPGRRDGRQTPPFRHGATLQSTVVVPGSFCALTTARVASARAVRSIVGLVWRAQYQVRVAVLFVVRWSSSTRRRGEDRTRRTGQVLPYYGV